MIESLIFKLLIKETLKFLGFLFNYFHQFRLQDKDTGDHR